MKWTAVTREENYYYWKIFILACAKPRHYKTTGGFRQIAKKKQTTVDSY